MFEVFLGAVISAVVTWFVAEKYHEKAGVELQETKDEIVELTSLLAKYLEELAKMLNDKTYPVFGMEDGKPVKIGFRRSFSVPMVVDVTVKQEEDSQ